MNTIENQHINANYFSFYDLPIQFLLDEKALKKVFLQKSKAFHPDFHTLESEEKQAAILELATYNTEAYKILSNEDTRMHYILQLKNMILPEGQEKMPQAFLLDMMDINEALMDLQIDFDKDILDKTKEEIATIEKNNFDEIFFILQNFDFELVTHNDLEKIKIFSLKKKYLLRIQKTLRTFAPQ